MKQPSFSIIVPVYGVEKYIERCARSLFCQKYERIQFIFVNDGTKDRSIEILKALIDKEFAQLREKIVIIDKENGGLPAARKTGLEYATGDYILHIDSDDYVDCQIVEKIAEAAAKTDADLIYYDLIKEYPQRISYKREYDYASDDATKFAFNILNGKSMGWLVTKCFKRSVYQSGPLYFAPCGVYEDVYLSLQLLGRCGSLYHLKEALYHYDRSNPQAYTAMQRRERHYQFCCNMLDLYDRYAADIDSSPLKNVAASLMYRVGGYTLRHKFDFFETHKELAEYLSSAPLGTNYYISLAAQLYVRFVAKIIRKK